MVADNPNIQIPPPKGVEMEGLRSSKNFDHRGIMINTHTCATCTYSRWKTGSLGRYLFDDDEWKDENTCICAIRAPIGAQGHPRTEPDGDCGEYEKSIDRMNAVAERNNEALKDANLKEDLDARWRERQASIKDESKRRARGVLYPPTIAARKDGRDVRGSFFGINEDTIAKCEDCGEYERFSQMSSEEVLRFMNNGNGWGLSIRDGIVCPLCTMAKWVAVKYAR